MVRKYLLLLVLVLINAAFAFAEDKLVTWNAPQGAALNNDFTVKVRQSNGKWITLSSYLIKVDEVRETRHFAEKASMATFDFTGTVEVAVTYNRGDVNTAKVRPLSYDIPFRIEKNTVTFQLNRPRNLSIEVNGDIFHNLHLFTSYPEEVVPDKKDPNVIYFGRGVHTVEKGELKVSSGKTVYLAGGAVLMGRVVIENAQNVKLLGRGIIDHTIKGGIHISNSRNVYVEGVVATQCATGGSNHVTIRNVKSISYYGWGDGMNVFASNNVLFDGVFCRNSDDCTTVYGTRLGFKGGCSNITMQNSTLWADVAHPIFIGIHGNAEKPEILENLNYVNIDILDHREKQLDYQGCLAINAGDNNLVRKVRFENIRIENFREGQLVNLRIFYNKKYCAAPGRGIEDVLFKDVSYTGTNAGTSIIEGYNEERKVKNIRFENLRINGKPIYDEMPDKPKWYKTSDMARIYTGPHVEDISFSIVENIKDRKNPVFSGFYADPEVLYAEKTKKYYIYPTCDGIVNWGSTQFKAFSSEDLVNWKEEGVILDLNNVSWAKKNAWAPCIIEKKQADGNYKYYYYYTAEKQIGVAVSDNPTGPFIDSGKPLIGKERPGGMTRGQNIDPDVFTDPVSGKTYLYWGNYYMAVCELNDDMISLKPNTTRLLIDNDKDYSEATHVFYRDGYYYFTWSKNDTRSPEYEVRYVRSKSLLEPIDTSKNRIVICKKPELGIYATGHHSVVRAANKDEWYIVYHRFQYPDAIKMGRDAGFHREVCIDKLEFESDGEIKQVIPRL